ncbi:MAG TPA: sulfatase-like hydrolase/transferase [Sphingomonadaceae bacterium]|nr:sulfatase-like hydrolase/transferase [Sphingomonadaceae bacterium]
MTDRTITRRELLASAAGITGASMIAPAAFAARKASASSPNIIFIMADDLGYADVSCYGRPDYETPAIDALAKQGLRFTQAYANSAVCSATRVGLITGRYQNRLPIGLEEPLGVRDVGLPPSHPTLPSLLRKVGYGTALIGKWHMGALPKYGPLKSGYDHFWGFRGGGLDYFSHSFIGKHDLWDDDREIEEPGYLTDLIGQHALEVIGRYAAKRQPFFLSVHFNAPHWPWEGPEDEAESRRLAASKNPFAVYDTDGGSQKTYAEMVTRMDMQIGRITKALADLGIADDTIVIFTSDNGGERYANTWPFTGKKTELLEGGLRIPAIIRWAGHVPADAVSEQVMISMDWLPTLLAIAGGAPDPAYPPDGIDLRDTLLAGAAPKPRTLCWRYLNLSQEACRDGDWKYLKILDNRFLFNVVDDPLERANLKDRHPEIYQRLLAQYQAWDAKMLPLDPEASTGGFTGHDLADHFGITKTRTLSID